MGSGQDRQAYQVDVFLHRSVRNLLGGPANAAIDDLPARIPRHQGDLLRAARVTVQPRLAEQAQFRIRLGQCFTQTVITHCTALAFADEKTDHLIVVTIPDYGITPFAANSDVDTIASELAQFNAIVIEESGLIEAPVVDIRDLWLQAKDDTSLIADDGLHPSGSMYTLWAQAVLLKAMDALSTSDLVPVGSCCGGLKI